MYGLIGGIRCAPGKARELASILLENASTMPGCRSYVVALDAEDEDLVWVTEVWEDQASHEASLNLPGVQAAIARGRPLIEGFASRTTTRPLGGHGLA